MSNQLFSQYDRQTLSTCDLYVYFHQALMDILLDGISFVGMWDDEYQELMISVSNSSTHIKDGKIYVFDIGGEEQDPRRIQKYFEECVRKIILGDGEDHAEPDAKWRYTNY